MNNCHGHHLYIEGMPSDNIKRMKCLASKETVVLVSVEVKNENLGSNKLIRVKLTT